jgi:hypothetical protein
MKAKILSLIFVGLSCINAVVAQKTRPKEKAESKQVIFAVLRDGKLIEPIAFIDADKLAPVEDESSTQKAFGIKYYKPKALYSLIFGGAKDGTVQIVKSNVGGECSGNSADIISRPVKVKISGLVMALATNAVLKTPAEAGLRRKPTPAERSEIEALVRAEYTKQGVAAAALKNLRYHNLTALDVDHDEEAEFVGSYWVAPKADERDLLFFIAEKDTSGKYALTLSDYSAVKPDDVMSGDVKDIDGGVGHELLLDVLDFDKDGTDEIFTLGQAFEGNNYYVYKREDGKWVKTYETYNYRCAF